MARHEEEREDLLAEATALVHRAELICPDIETEVVVGFRANGAACIYVGSEPVFQFNTSNELRRLFVDGDMLKAEEGALIRLRRERAAEETTLLSSQLSERQTEELLQQARDYCDAIDRAITAGTCVISRQVPEEIDMLRRISDWVRQLSRPLVIAQRPNVQV